MPGSFTSSTYLPFPRMELPVLLESLDRRDRPLIGLHGEHRARLHRATVEEHRAGAAVGGVAADVRAGHPEVLAEEMDKERARIDVDVVRRSVDRHVDLERALPFARGGRGFDCHLTSLPWRGRRPCGSRAASARGSRPPCTRPDRADRTTASTR